MSTRYFSEEEVQDIVFGDCEHKTVAEYSLSSGRWSEYMVTVVHTVDDDKFYRLNWERGLTEMQENYYEGGDFPEVFKHTSVKVETTTDYFTAEELDAKNASSVEDDIESLRLVSDTDEVDKCFSTENLQKLEDALTLLDELKPLDLVTGFKDHNQAARHYLETLLEYGKKKQK